MALTVTPSPAGIQAPRPLEVKPVDLQPALDRLHNAFREGFIDAQDIQKRTEIGNSDAEAKRKQNEAAGAKAEQDRITQEGGKGYTRPGRFSRLTGIGGGPKPDAAPAVEPKNDPNAVQALPVDAAPRAPIITPVGPPGSQMPAAGTPAAAPGAGNTPFLAATQQPDFNPAHESTDDLLGLVGEAGYSLLG